MNEPRPTAPLVATVAGGDVVPPRTWSRKPVVPLEEVAAEALGVDLDAAPAPKGKGKK